MEDVFHRTNGRGRARWTHNLRRGQENVVTRRRRTGRRDEEGTPAKWSPAIKILGHFRVNEEGKDHVSEQMAVRSNLRRTEAGRPVMKVNEIKKGFWIDEKSN
ncbi:hypothetical protein RUM44_010203 [Polyplax serrata]|uniref:Uncharacterized protein n=1 Tax=Polyplax serrata TaxID=468196 RepID=A0ABR1AUU8_POLSC